MHLVHNINHCPEPSLILVNLFRHFFQGFNYGLKGLNFLTEFIPAINVLHYLPDGVALFSFGRMERRQLCLRSEILVSHILSSISAFSCCNHIMSHPGTSTRPFQVIFILVPAPVRRWRSAAATAILREIGRFIDEVCE